MPRLDPFQNIALTSPGVGRALVSLRRWLFQGPFEGLSVCLRDIVVSYGSLRVLEASQNFLGPAYINILD